MKGDRLPNEHHVGLHCSPGAFLTHDAAGNVIGVSAAAFRVDNDGISVNWLEYCEGAPDDQFSNMCALLKRGRTVRKSHRVGIIAVVDIENTASANDGALHAEHDPLDDPPNPGHSLIIGVGPDDADVLNELSALVQLREFA